MADEESRVADFPDRYFLEQAAPAQCVVRWLSGSDRDLANQVPHFEWLTLYSSSCMVPAKNHSCTPPRPKPVGPPRAPLTFTQSGVGHPPDRFGSFVAGKGLNFPPSPDVQLGEQSAQHGGRHGDP